MCPSYNNNVIIVNVDRNMVKSRDPRVYLMLLSEVRVWYYCVLVINYHSNVSSSNYIIYVLHILIYLIKMYIAQIIICMQTKLFI